MRELKELMVAPDVESTSMPAKLSTYAEPQRVGNEQSWSRSYSAMEVVMVRFGLG